MKSKNALLFGGAGRSLSCAPFGKFPFICAVLPYPLALGPFALGAKLFILGCFEPELRKPGAAPKALRACTGVEND